MFDYLYEKDVAAMQTIIIPKVLFSSDKFSKLSAEAKVLYALLLGCFENGCQYARYSVQKIRNDLCCSAERAAELLTELSDFHLIQFENNRINVISLWEREDSNV
ncbi:MAG: replication initiator protein A [Ruminococcus sp.]|nr:replication initiator protein A [Ruminococcus sp.]